MKFRCLFFWVSWGWSNSFVWFFLRWVLFVLLQGLLEKILQNSNTTDHSQPQIKFTYWNACKNLFEEAKSCTASYSNKPNLDNKIILFNYKNIFETNYQKMKNLIKLFYLEFFKNQEIYYMKKWALWKRLKKLD